MIIMHVYVLMLIAGEISVAIGSATACRPCDVKCIKLDSHMHLAIYIIYILNTVNAMVN